MKRPSKNLAGFAFSVVCILFSYNMLSAQVKFVTTSGSNTNNGDTWETAYSSIDYAVNTAGGRTIYVMEGTYTNEHITLPLNATIAIQGSFDASSVGTDITKYDPVNNITFLNRTASTASLFDVKNGDFTLKGFKLTSTNGTSGNLIWFDNTVARNNNNFLFKDLWIDGTATNNNGTIWVHFVNNSNITFENILATGTSGGPVVKLGDNDNSYGSTFTFTRTAFRLNVNGTGQGGAIFIDNNEAASPQNTYTISGAIFCDNSTSGITSEGGAIYVRDASSMTIQNSKFFYNSAKDAGAIYSFKGDISITGCTFYNNTAITNDGGAIDLNTSLNNAGTISLTNNIFHGNSSPNDGGAINVDGLNNGLLDKTAVAITNNAFYNNRATTNGDAIWTNDAIDQFDGNTFIGNGSATVNGSEVLHAQTFAANGHFGNNTSPVSNGTFQGTQATYSSGITWGTGNTFSATVVPAAPDDVCPSTISPVYLPIQLGGFHARISGNILKVHWSTNNEINNDHFDVLISKDGISFMKAGMVKSKATGGNSSQLLYYDFAMNTASSSLLAALAAGILLTGFCFLTRKRILWVVAVIVIAGVCLMIQSCRKNRHISTADKHEWIYVKIAQVNKDGNTEYSKIVLAIEE